MVRPVTNAFVAALVPFLFIQTPVQAIDYQIKYVPDFDQKRGAGPGIPGLPNNGSCYCMPTSCINWVAFLANRGYPELAPPGNWQNPDRYNIVTAAIDDLGAARSTSPGGPDPNDPKNNLPCGTGGEEAVNALVAGFNGLTPGKFVVTMKYADGNYAPTYATLVNKMLTGGLILLRYGHYDPVVIPFAGEPAYVRDGGHIVSLTGVTDYPGANTVLRYRNPSSDESPDVLTLQSTFSTDTSTTQNVTTVFDGVTRTQTKLTSITNPKFIDGYIQIKPLFGLHVPNCCGDLQMNALNPILAIHGNPPQNATYTSPSGTPIIDIEIDPELDRYFMITAGAVGGGSPVLWSIKTLAIPPDPIMPLANPTSITAGRRGELYVLDGSLLRIINPDSPTGQIGSMPVTPPIDGKIVYHDALDEVAGLSVDHLQMVFVKWTGTAGTIRTRPMAATIFIQGTPTVVADHATGRFLVKGALNNSIFIVEDNGTSMALVDQINLVPTLTEGRTDAMFIDANGRVGFAANSPMVVFENINGNWQQTDNHPFAGLVAGKHFRLAASRTNFNPATMSGPGQLDVIPDEFGPIVADCHADIAPGPHGDGQVNVLDLLAVINSWGPCPGPTPEMCPADFMPAGFGDDVVNVADLLGVINNWGPCP